MNKKFFVAGISVTTTNAAEANPETAKIGALWQDFFVKNITEKIANKVSNKIIACYHNYASDCDGVYTLTIGYEVLSLDEISNELTTLSVPEQKYQIFTAKGTFPQALIEEWVKIWHYFKKEEQKRAYIVDFEVHNPLTQDSVDIYIGLK